MMNTNKTHGHRSERYPHIESIEQERQAQLKAISDLRAKLSPAKRQPAEVEQEELAHA